MHRADDRGGERAQIKRLGPLAFGAVGAENPEGSEETFPLHNFGPEPFLVFGDLIECD